MEGRDNLAAITLEKAKQHLNMWLEAEEVISTHQSYTMGSRSLTRADLGKVAERIKYWSGVVNSLENGRRNRIYRAVPRDL